MICNFGSTPNNLAILSDCKPAQFTTNFVLYSSCSVERIKSLPSFLTEISFEFVFISPPFSRINSAYLFVTAT